MRLRSSLYKKCGVVLDDVGQVTEDKAIQAEPAPGNKSTNHSHNFILNNTLNESVKLISNKSDRHTAYFI